MQFKIFNGGYPDSHIYSYIQIYLDDGTEVGFTVLAAMKLQCVLSEFIYRVAPKVEQSGPGGTGDKPPTLAGSGGSHSLPAASGSPAAAVRQQSQPGTVKPTCEGGVPCIHPDWSNCVDCELYQPA